MVKAVVGLQFNSDKKDLNYHTYVVYKEILINLLELLINYSYDSVYDPDND